MIRRFPTAGLILACVSLLVTAHAQPMRIDRSVPLELETGSDIVASARYVAAPDKRFFALGISSPFYVNGMRAPYGFARLLPDGTNDPTFTAQLNEGETVRAAASLPDGRVLVATNIRSYMDSGLGRIVRLLASGAIDSSFSALDIYGSSVELALLDDGSAIAWGEFTVINLTGTDPRRNFALVRIGPTGALDPDFASTLPLALRQVTSLAIVENRVVFTGTNWPADGNYYFQRLTNSGAVDPSFSPAASAGTLKILTVLGEGDLLVFSGDRLQRLNSDGSADPAFAAQIPEIHGVSRAAALTGGRVAVEADTGSSAFGPIESVFVLAADGALERDCRLLPGAERIQRLGCSLSDGSVVIAQGTLIPEPNPPYSTQFEPGVANPALCLVDPAGGTLAKLVTKLDSVTRGGSIDQLWTDAEERLLIEGNFTHFAGIARPGYARINVDGTLDSTFAPVAATPLFHLPDGKIIASQQVLGEPDAEGFHSYVSRVVRLDTEGRVDPNLVAPPDIDLIGAQWLTVAADGRILVVAFAGGIRLVWLAPNGQVSEILPTTFSGIVYNPSLPNTALNVAAHSAAALPDGKILVAGRASVNGAPAVPIVRLNADGSSDDSYRPVLSPLASPAAAIALPDGGAYVFGTPEDLLSAPSDAALRLAADGSADTFVSSALAGSTRMPDGTFYNIYQRQRFHPDGSPDLSFSLPAFPGYDNFTYGAGTIAADGSMWIVGGVQRYRQDSLPFLLRLVPDESYGFPVQPLSQTSTAGYPLTLQAEFGTSAGVSFQWTHNGERIPGATGRSLHLTRVAATDAGEYRLVATIGTSTYTSNAATLTVAPNTSRIIALSGRTRVPAASEGPPQIGGFIIRGEQERRVLLRAIGLGLRSMLPAESLLPQPVLRLFRGEVPIAENIGGISADDRAEAARQVGAFPVPADPNEGPINSGSALLLSLTPGLYTAHTLGQDGRSGISLFEIYDADTEATSSFASGLSLRGHAGSGADVLIIGLIVRGENSIEVLIRGAGPDITSRGVPDALSDPQVTIFNYLDRPLTNDNWEDQVDIPQLLDATARAQLTPFPRRSRDAILHVRLRPGVYTIHGGGINGATGEMLLEVYTIEP